MLLVALVAIAIAGCGGGGSSSENSPVAKAGSFRSCVEREIGTYPTAGRKVPDASKALTAFGVDGSALGEAGARVSLLHYGPDAYVYEDAEEAEAAAAEVRRTGFTPVVVGNVVWTAKGSLPQNWEQMLHNCVGQST